MNAATVKEWLQITDITKLMEIIASFQSRHNEDDAAAATTTTTKAEEEMVNAADEEQRLKVQILLWNRIFQIQKEQKFSLTDQAITVRNTGTVWMRMGDTDRAIGQYQKSLEMCPTGDATIQTYQLLGQAYVNASEYDKAIESHQRAIDELVAAEKSSTVDLALAYAQVAGVLEAQSEFSTALDWLQKALDCASTITVETEQLPVVATIHAQRGTLLEKLGEYSQAVESLKIAFAALQQTKGKDHDKTKEIEYILEMASELAEG